VSEPEAVLVRSHFPQIADRITVIPNGVDMAALSASEPFEVDRTIILSAGRLETYKHVDLTIRSFAHLDDSFALHITGDGPVKAELEALSAEIGLDGRVAFLGRVDTDTLYRWFRTAPVYVSMSSNEAMPVTVVEMLAAGAGVVASDIPAHQAIAETVGAGRLFLVPLDVTPEGLAAVIRDVAHKQASGQLPTASVASWDSVTDQTLTVYERAVQQFSRRRVWASPSNTASSDASRVATFRRFTTRRSSGRS
jgi:glycosyltransferase involved in cell wall biosynthesis